MKDELIESAKSFTGGENYNEESWNRLLKELEELHDKNVKSKTQKP